jgi:hypothetical protein
VVSTDGTPVSDLARVAFAAAQLNWANPSKSQRLPMVFKRTDEDLESRYAQDIRKIA